MPDLVACINARSKLPRSEIDWLRSIGQQQTIPRGGAFCSIGQSHHELGFLHEGVLQVYAVSSDGAHVVLDFVFPGVFALALRSAINDLPSEVCFEAVTPCVLSVWPYGVRHAAFARHVEWERLAAQLTDEMFVRKQQRDLSLRMRSAKERYMEMLSELPEGGRGIPQHLLASYLGITPQYLSRIRREERRQTRAAPPTASKAQGAGG